MTRYGTVYVTLDQWVHLAAEVLGSDAATIRRTADLNLIDSALHAPAAGFGEQDLYPDVIDKAAVLCWHLVNNHGLPDGNKRCAFVAMVVFLRRNNVEWNAPTADDAVSTMVAVASKHLDVASLAEWIQSHTI
ncbi:MAG TPA: type II toxin-antitoxin system death-on-curing family toxin [Microthrixaceae bacterium]|nr:type II toxin-antitoxin system death-on-curing family toxin [Microthrixaceae bacterium]